MDALAGCEHVRRIGFIESGDLGSKDACGVNYDASLNREFLAGFDVDRANARDPTRGLLKSDDFDEIQRETAEISERLRQRNCQARIVELSIEVEYAAAQACLPQGR